MRRLKSLSSLISTTVAALVLLAIGAFSTPSYAQVKPGDFITPENASKVQDLVGPGVYYKVQRGMSMKIVPTERVDWPPPYKDATEKYSSQVRLSQDKRSIVGFVAGQPFPLIDANDPDVAVKVIWNNVFRPITSDDYDLRFYDCDSEYEKKGPQTGQIEYFQIGHYAGYDLVGRTEVEPIPTDPDSSRPPAATGCSACTRFWRRRKFAEPDSSDGATPIRNVATTSGASTPARAASAASTKSIMSSSTTAGGTSAHAWDPDHYSGFNPKTEAVHLQIPG